MTDPTDQSGLNPDAQDFAPTPPEFSYVDKNSADKNSAEEKNIPADIEAELPESQPLEAAAGEQDTLEESPDEPAEQLSLTELEEELSSHNAFTYPGQL